MSLRGRGFFFVSTYLNRAETHAKQTRIHFSLRVKMLKGTSAGFSSLLPLSVSCNSLCEGGAKWATAGILGVTDSSSVCWRTARDMLELEKDRKSVSSESCTQAAYLCKGANLWRVPVSSRTGRWSAFARTNPTLTHVKLYIRIDAGGTLPSYDRRGMIDQATSFSASLSLPGSVNPE